MKSNLNGLILNDFLTEIGGRVRGVLPFAKDIILFGSSLSVDAPGDFDVVVVVPDEVNLFDIYVSISPIAAQLTVRAGALVSCFPIKVSVYEACRSQFVRNIRKDGKKL